MLSLNDGYQYENFLQRFFFTLWIVLGFWGIIPSTAIAQSVIQAWAERYNGPGNGNDSAAKVVTDSFGNVYVTGYSYNGTNDDYATIKYDANGNQLWVARYDNGSEDAATDIAVDASGNVYVTGSSSNGTNDDFATIKYDANGNHLWITRYDNGQSDYPVGIALDTYGNAYVTGVSCEDANCSNPDYTTVKYDTNGNQLWVNQYDNGGYDHPAGISVDSLGNIFVTGVSYQGSNADYLTIKYGNGNSCVARYDNGFTDSAEAITVDHDGNFYVTGLSSDGVNDQFATIKYDTNCNQLWVARFDNQGYSSGAVAIVVDLAGNVYVTGQSLYHFATVKYDSAGNQLWVARFNNGQNFDIPNAIAVDSSGNVYVTGVSEITSNLNGGHDEFATIKYDPSGNQLWIMAYDAGPWNWSSAITLDTMGNVYVTGSSYLVSSNPDFATVKYVNVPDLVESNVISPAIGTQLLPGSSISVTDTVANQGSASAGAFTVGIYLYPAATGERYTFLGARTVSSLAPGGSSTGTTTVKIPTNVVGGTYYLQAVADYSNQIPEANESNNSYTNTSGVITIPPADLIMTAVSTTSMSVVRGGSLSLSYTVKNQGIGGASSFQIGFYLSTDNNITTGDKLLSYVYVKNGLNPGSSLSGTVTMAIPTTVSPGTYYLGAYADYKNTVVESNEANNGLATSGTIQVQ